MPDVTSPKKQRVTETLQVAKLSKEAILPTRGSPSAAGYDLYSAHDLVIPARGKGLVKTDLQIKVPDGTYGRVAPRSGLAWKQHIDIGAGVVDEDYRGNLGELLLLPYSFVSRFLLPSLSVFLLYRCGHVQPRGCPVRSEAGGPGGSTGLREDRLSGD